MKFQCLWFSCLTWSFVWWLLMLVCLFHNIWMMQKMINGMTVSRWACINFSRSVQDSVARTFCNELAQMCQVSGMVVSHPFDLLCLKCNQNFTLIHNVFFVKEFNLDPVIPIYNAKPEQVEKALKHVYHVSSNKTKGKELELLLVILPDNNGSLYGKPNSSKYMYNIVWKMKMKITILQLSPRGWGFWTGP